MVRSKTSNGAAFHGDPMDARFQSGRRPEEGRPAGPAQEKAWASPQEPVTTTTDRPWTISAAMPQRLRSLCPKFTQGFFLPSSFPPHPFFSLLSSPCADSQKRNSKIMVAGGFSVATLGGRKICNNQAIFELNEQNAGTVPASFLGRYTIFGPTRASNFFFCGI